MIKAGLTKQTETVKAQGHLLFKGHLSELPPPRARCAQQALPVEGVLLARGIQMRSTDPVDLPTMAAIERLGHGTWAKMGNETKN
jgi:hypothetical protein